MERRPTNLSRTRSPKVPNVWRRRMRSTLERYSIGLALSLSLCACQGIWGDVDPDGDGEQCDGEPRPGPSGLRRLTPAEYRNTVRDLFPGVSIPSLTLTRDGAQSNYSIFDNDM